MRQGSILLTVFVLLAVLARLPTQAQTGVTAEAIGQANVRANTDVNANLMGEITAGTRYPVLGRSQFYPWLLLGDPATNQPFGWVFQDLLTVQGDLNTVPFSTLEIGSAPPLPTATLPAVATLDPLATATLASAPLNQASPTAAPVGSVFGTIAGEINIRSGPSVDYPRVGVGRAGERFEIIATHTQFQWVEINYPAAPGGTAWVLLDLLDVEGDLSILPAVSRTTFALPAFTPTPPIVHEATVIGASAVPLSLEFRALGDQIWNMMLGAGFDPQTSTLGGVFLMNLQTGEALTFGDDIAFSGMSISKIAILATYYGRLNAPPNDEQAYTIAQAMICSENISTNRLLAAIGDGNPYVGAGRVSEFLQALALNGSFIYTPYANDPFITPQAPRTRITDFNQTAAEPDPFNQMTVAETGGLLNSLYQCAYRNSGPLLTSFAGQYTPTECRQMLHVMSSNEIGALIEAGVPEGIRVAHKHGWIDDTHGDAGIVFTPGGDYVLVMAMHTPTWLNFEESSGLMEEISRTVYNYFNPTAPLAAARDIVVPECNLLGDPVVEDLTRVEFEG